jgi:aspartyl/asparaginyl-tRNA synthetase
MIVDPAWCDAFDVLLREAELRGGERVEVLDDLEEVLDASEINHHVWECHEPYILRSWEDTIEWLRRSIGM